MCDGAAGRRRILSVPCFGVAIVRCAFPGLSSPKELLTDLITFDSLGARPREFPSIGRAGFHGSLFFARIFKTPAILDTSRRNAARNASLRLNRSAASSFATRRCNLFAPRVTFEFPGSKMGAVRPDRRDHVRLIRDVCLSAWEIFIQCHAVVCISNNCEFKRKLELFIIWINSTPYSSFSRKARGCFNTININS